MRKTARSRKAGQETEARIFEAAEEVFARFGFEGARMDQVAEKAGVEKANIYYYFSGKQELYAALMERIINRLLSEVSEFLTEEFEGDPLSRLDVFLDIFFKLIEQYQGLIALAFTDMLHPPRESQARAPGRQMLAQIETVAMQLISDGMERGDFRKQDPAQALITLEGAVFYYFFLPEDRIESLTGAAKFSAGNLADRRQALREQMLRILA